MRMTSPSSLPSSHTVSTATGGRIVGRKRVAEGPLLGVGEATGIAAVGSPSGCPWPLRPEIAWRTSSSVSISVPERSTCGFGCPGRDGWGMRKIPVIVSGKSARMRWDQPRNLIENTLAEPNRKNHPVRVTDEQRPGPSAPHRTRDSWARHCIFGHRGDLLAPLFLHIQAFGPAHLLRLWCRFRRIGLLVGDHQFDLLAQVIRRADLEAGLRLCVVCLQGVQDRIVALELFVSLQQRFDVRPKLPLRLQEVLARLLELVFRLLFPGLTDESLSTKFDLAVGPA